MITPVEKALVEAMAIRYSDDTGKDQSQLNTLYKDAMSNVYKNYNSNE